MEMKWRSQLGTGQEEVAADAAGWMAGSIAGALPVQGASGECRVFDHVGLHEIDFNVAR